VHFRHVLLHRAHSPENVMRLCTVLLHLTHVTRLSHEALRMYLYKALHAFTRIIMQFLFRHYFLAHVIPCSLSGLDLFWLTSPTPVSVGFNQFIIHTTPGVRPSLVPVYFWVLSSFWCVILATNSLGRSPNIYIRKTCVYT